MGIFKSITANGKTASYWFSTPFDLRKGRLLLQGYASIEADGPPLLEKTVTITDTHYADMNAIYAAVKAQVSGWNDAELF